MGKMSKCDPLWIRLNMERAVSTAAVQPSNSSYVVSEEVKMSGSGSGGSSSSGNTVVPPQKKNRIISCSRIFSSMATATAEEVEEPSLDEVSTKKANNGGGNDDNAIEFDSVAMEKLFALAQRRTTALSLADMYRYASGETPDSERSEQRLFNAQFLHRELPVRIAQRAVDLLTLPHGLNKTRQIRRVAQIYLDYIQRFRNMPTPTTLEDESKFTEMLQGIVMDRVSIANAIAMGVASLKDERREEFDVRRLHEMEEALYRFFTARVGLRFLTEHHILSASYRNESNAQLRQKQSCLELDAHSHPGFLGCIQNNCNPVQELRRVAEQVTRHCRDCYDGLAPQIEIVDCTKGHDTATFTYVPHHLQYMLHELIKNSCRATIRRHLNGDAKTLPPIRVVVVKGAENVTIKITDQGGGLPRSAMRKLWMFAHTSDLSDKTMDSRESQTKFGTDSFTGGEIRGFGLPLARIYARYFGGELTLKTIEGYGVDVYLYLPILGTACENLPDRVTFSPGNLDSSATTTTTTTVGSALRDGSFPRGSSSSPTKRRTTTKTTTASSSSSDYHDESPDSFRTDEDVTGWGYGPHKTIELLSRRAL